MSDQPRMDFSIDQPILKSFEFQLNLSDQKYLDYYRGSFLDPNRAGRNDLTQISPFAVATKVNISVVLAVLAHMTVR